MLHGLVAERLLLADGGDEAIPGLEIAWHLVRADRLHDAIPFLLAGGKESIRRGAPHEADLAHEELIAACVIKLQARRAEVRQNPTSSTEQNLVYTEAFTAGIDHAMRVAREHLARLEHRPNFPAEQEPFEFEMRHA